MGWAPAAAWCLRFFRGRKDRKQNASNELNSGPWWGEDSALIHDPSLCIHGASVAWLAWLS